MATYNRYESFKTDAGIKPVPFIKIPVKSSDFYEVYHRNKTRLDILSYNYYGDANYAWLILQANPEYGSMEYSIPDGVTLRIPFPLGQTIEEYRQGIIDYNTLN